MRSRGLQVELDMAFYQKILDNLYDGVYFVDTHRTINYWNQGAERLTGYKREEVEGTSCFDNILMHVNEAGDSLCHNGCPLTHAISHDQSVEAEVFLRHKEGHRLPVSIRATPIKDAEGRVVGAVEVFKDLTQQRSIEQRMEELAQMALLDPLTRLANRRHTEANLQMRLEELSRYEWPFGVMFIDIDNFKSINDIHGHEVGDKVLRLVSLTLLNSLRPFDFLGRWGGEEFLSIVVNVNPDQLYQVANRARRLVEQSRLSVGSGTIQVTISIGATLARKEEGLQELIRRADRLMYQSKQSGRNRLTLDTGQASTHA